MGLPNRYSLQNFLRAIQNPSLVREEISRTLYNLGMGINRRYYRQSHSPDDPILQYDWDNLIILDGCRYDVFFEENDLPGTLQRRVSGRSESWEFLSRNFGGMKCHDTVYITANPHWYKLENNTFYDVVDLLTEEWDAEKGTVLPEDVTKRTKEIATEFPNKRLIIHFMQPHFPFLGPTAENLDHKGLTIHLENESEANLPNVWAAAQRGEVATEAVQAAYRENLQIVLNQVEGLIDCLEGRTVVTADHGNLIGEALKPVPVSGFGHPKNFYAPGIVNVPWNVIDTGTSKNVIAEEPLSSTSTNNEQIEDRLQALGYR
jgi:hypothetical protein